MSMKKSGKGENASDEDVIGTSGVGGERLPLPKPVSDEEEERDTTIEGRDTVMEEPPAAPPPDDLLARLTAAMEVIAASSADASTKDRALDRLAAAFERMASVQLEAADRVANATRIASRPENQVAPNISVYNPRGEKDFPKPPLKCRMLLPWDAEPESLTREEVELLNLLRPGEYIVRRNDSTKVKITVRAIYKLDSDDLDILLMNHDTAFNNDNHSLIPPFSELLRQILKQNPKTRTSADQVLTMDEEEALILAGKLNDGSIPGNGQVISVGA